MAHPAGQYDNDVFISYSSKQERAAYLVRDVLTAHDLSCWMAPDSIPNGSDYTTEIPRAIEGCKVVVLMLTSDSQNSEYVKREINLAVKGGKTIIPFAIQNCKIEKSFDFLISKYQRINAFSRLSDALEELLVSVHTIIEKQYPSTDKTYLKERLRLYRRKTILTASALAAAGIVLFIVLSLIFGSQAIRNSGSENDAKKGENAVSTVNEGTVGECQWSYSEETATLVISGEGSSETYQSAGFDVNVPWKDYLGEIRTLKVEEGVTDLCTNAMNGAKKLSSVSLPSTLTSLKINAFHSCSTLKEIKLPEGLAYIGSNVFYGCSGLSEIGIPASVTKIEDNAFLSTGLKTVSVDDGNPSYASLDGCLYDRKMTKLLFYPPRKTDTEFSAPEGVTNIADSAFSGALNLTAVVLPDTVTRIGKNTFSGCNAMKKITLSENLISIGEKAFYMCSALESVELSDNVTDIGAEAFYSCAALKEVRLPPLLTQIPSKLFSFCRSLETAEIQDGARSILPEAFADCSSLTSVVIPKSVVSIDESAFENDDQLTVVCDKDSYAEQFAQEMGYAVESK